VQRDKSLVGGGGLTISADATFARGFAMSGGLFIQLGGSANYSFQSGQATMDEIMRFFSTRVFGHMRVHPPRTGPAPITPPE